MLPYTVRELAPALQGSLQHVDPQTKVSGLTTDSRKISLDSGLFVYREKTTMVTPMRPRQWPMVLLD